jgi:hypothetical protein
MAGTVELPFEGGRRQFDAPRGKIKEVTQFGC